MAAIVNLNKNIANFSQLVMLLNATTWFLIACRWLAEKCVHEIEVLVVFLWHALFG